MAEHRALAAARGAAGVEDGRHVVCRFNGWLVLVRAVHRTLQQGAAAVVTEGENTLRTALESDFRDPAKILRRAHHHGRLGVGDEIFDFSALVGRIQRQEHIAGTQGGQVQRHGLDRFFHLHRYPAAARDLQTVQQVGDAGAHALQIAPAVVQRLATGGGGLDGHLVQIVRKCVAQCAKQIVIFHACLLAWWCCTRLCSPLSK